MNTMIDYPPPLRERLDPSSGFLPVQAAARAQAAVPPPLPSGDAWLAADLLALTGASVTLDESAGLQNDLGSDVPGDADDNDVAAGMLPAAFVARLAALWGGSPAPLLDAALSGHDGSNAGQDLIAITASPLSEVRAFFSDSAGQWLDGDVSGLATVDGVDLFLWTDDGDEHLVLGRQGVWEEDLQAYVADPAGRIALAGYLEPQGDPVSGARLWTVQYEALRNPDPMQADEPLDLANHLWVTLQETRSFSLEGIPSGQNLFLTVGDSELAVVITGRDPANQSAGENIMSGDTINTSQAMGESIGTNNQHIDPPRGGAPGEDMYFTFVAGADPGRTVPDLDEGEADLEANIAFTALHPQNGAAILVTQVTPTSKAATLKLTAFNTDLETGDGYIDGLGDADDLMVGIAHVRVFQRVGGEDVPVDDPDLSILDNGDGSFTVRGAKEGYWVAYETGETHTRLLVENIGDGDAGYDASFDIGGFGLPESRTQTLEIGTQVRFEDDAPWMEANMAPVPTLTVDDSDFGTNASASFAGFFTQAFGNDGFKDEDDNDVPDPDALSYRLDVKSPGVASGLVDSLSGDPVTLDRVGDAVIGSAAGQAVFRITVDALTGDVTLDQQRAVRHDDPADAEEAGASAARLATADLVTLTATAIDGDLDSAAATREIGDAFRFEDDGPWVEANLAPVPTLTVDDSDFGTNASASFAGFFTQAFGNDGFKDEDDNDVPDPDALSYRLDVKSPGVASGLVDSLSGDPVTLDRVGDAVIGSAAGQAVFRITVDALTGDVTLDQQRAVRHDDPADAEEAGASAARLATADLVTLTATAIDGDLDSAAATREIGDVFRFEDDGPLARSITHLVGLNDTLPVTGTYDFDIGHDEVGNLAQDGIRLLGFSGTVDGHAITQPILEWHDESDSHVAYRFSFDYLPGPGSTTPGSATGSVVFDKQAGTYAFQLDAPIQGETTYSTSTPEATFNYDRVGSRSPEIVVQQYDDAFFGVLTARAAVPPSDTDDLLAGDDRVFVPGERFDSESEAYLNVATNTVGANSDTLQAGELLNFDFFAENPVSGPQSPPQRPEAGIDPDTPVACATAIDLILDQINVGKEDLAILLKLYDVRTDAYTTRLLLADAVADFVYQPDSRYWKVSIGKEDYDSAHYQIQGLQVLSSTEAVTGTGYRLSNGEAVALTASGNGLADTSDMDVFKIIQIDLHSEQTLNYDTDLAFTGELVDSDGDTDGFGFNVHLEADGMAMPAQASVPPVSLSGIATVLPPVAGVLA